MRSMATLPQTYTVHYDPAANIRMNKACFGHYWRAWLKHGCRVGASFGLVGAVVFVLISFYSAKTYTSMALAVILVLGFVTGLLTPLLTYIRIADKRESDPDAGEVWTCVMSEEGWSFQRKDGLLNFIPWSLMKLLYEHPEGWYVNYQHGQVWVYRKPLRDAGLEETFKEKLTE